MTDVQVSNARRIGFTALALVVFLLDVEFTYREVFGYWQETGLMGQSGAHPVTFKGRPFYGIREAVEWEREILWRDTLWWAIPTLALLPSLLFAMAGHNSPARAVRDGRLLVTGALITCNIACAALLGDHNGLPGEQWGPLLAARQARLISPLWLLLPTTLTVAFIINNAWRRAVRDAEVEVEAVGEDE